MDALPPTPTLPAGPLVLRPFRNDDMPLVIDAGRDPLIPLITTVPADGDAEAARAFVARQSCRPLDGEGHSFAIADAATGLALGQIGLWPRPAATARVGYWVGAAHRGRGVAGTALRALAGWGFTERRLARIELLVEPWNTASRRTAERAGFRCEGLLRGAEDVGGQRRDMLLHGRLHDDPEPGAEPAAGVDDPREAVALLEDPAADVRDPLVLLIDTLGAMRAALHRKIEGLDDDALRTVAGPVSWSPLGLVSHLTAVERRWLRWGFLAEPLAEPYPADEWTPVAEPAIVLAAHHAEVARARATAAGAGIGTPSRVGGRFPDATRAPTLGRILVHLVQEYARHVGQLDVVREALDGTTGE